jgi:hypothetical protein
VKGAPPVDSGSQDPDPAGGPRDKEVAGSQLLEPALSPEPQVGSQLPEDAAGPEDQDAIGSQLLEATAGPEPMEVDALTPSPLEGPEHPGLGLLHQ